jgi:hypothetical protein
LGLSYWTVIVLSVLPIGLAVDPHFGKKMKKMVSISLDSKCIRAIVHSSLWRTKQVADGNGDHTCNNCSYSVEEDILP